MIRVGLTKHLPAGLIKWFMFLNNNNSSNTTGKTRKQYTGIISLPYMESVIEFRFRKKRTKIIIIVRTTIGSPTT